MYCFVPHEENDDDSYYCRLRLKTGRRVHVTRPLATSQGSSAGSPTPSPAGIAQVQAAVKSPSRVGQLARPRLRDFCPSVSAPQNCLATLPGNSRFRGSGSRCEENDLCPSVYAIQLQGRYFVHHTHLCAKCLCYHGHGQPRSRSCLGADGDECVVPGTNASVIRVDTEKKVLTGRRRLRTMPAWWPNTCHARAAVLPGCVWDIRSALS